MSGFVFNRYAYFRYASFRDVAFFEEATFRNNATFEEATFSWRADFSKAKFSGFARFRETIFTEGAIFNKATFSGNANFKTATFNGSAYFSSAAFKSTTRFDHARFLTHVPEFHAADLYDGTVFPVPDRPEENWPSQSGEGVMPADAQKRAYSRLRLFFAKTQQIDEEQFFHRQEMRCKRAMAKGGTRVLYSLYALLSDYGISIWRPLAAMGVLVVFGAALFSLHTGMQGTPPAGSTFWQGMGWSLANALPFTGFGRTYFGAGFYQALPTWLKIYAGAQTLAAIPLLFLLGLGLRNTFRLR